MNMLSIRLFRQFSVVEAGEPLAGLESFKVQELLSYLLLYRRRAHHRENLTNLFWPDSSPNVARKYLRHTLWQLQSALDARPGATAGDVVEVEAEWLQIKPGSGLWLDVATLEAAFARVEGQPGTELSAAAASALAEVVDLYDGDLLEGWYQEWCLFERTRLQDMYLLLLDKLIEHAEATGRYEAGIGYGMRALRYDAARECTHRSLMRLRYRSGDRTGALRQYERCAALLQQELGVKPAQRTNDLYHRMRLDRPLSASWVEATHLSPAPRSAATLQLLQQLHATMCASEQQVEQLLAVFQEQSSDRPST